MQTAHNGIPIPHFMYGTAWKKEDTSRYVQLAVQAGFRAIDTANQLIHYHEALVGEALLVLGETRGSRGINCFSKPNLRPSRGRTTERPMTPSPP